MALKNHRDKFVAHALRQTRAEKKALAGSQASIENAKYGFEVDLLQETVKVVDLWYRGVVGGIVNWDLLRETSETRARALWHGCKIQVLA